MKSKLGVLAASLAVAFAVSGPAAAERIVVYSHLGEPLSALLEVAAADAPEGSGAWIASEADYEAAGSRRPAWAGSATLIIKEIAPGKRAISVATPEPIGEAASLLLVRIGDVARPESAALRQYALMLDPLESEQPEPKAADKAGSGQGAKDGAKGAGKPKDRPQGEAQSDILVRRGDTLQAIASRRPMEGIARESLIVAYAKANPKAFREGNPHEMKTGAVLKAPSRQLAESIDPKQARRILAEAARQSKAWREAAAGGAREAAERVGAAGEIEGSVSEKAPAPAGEDRFRLGKGADQEKLAMKKALDEALDRVSQLEKIQKDLKALVTAQNDQLSKLSESKKALEEENAKAREALAKAMGAAGVAKPLPPLPEGKIGKAPEPAALAAEPKPEDAKPLDPKPLDPKPLDPKLSEAGDMDAAAKLETKPEPKPEPKPKPKNKPKPKPIEIPPPPERSALDAILESILWPWSGVLLGSLAVASMVWRLLGGKGPGETTTNTQPELPRKPSLWSRLRLGKRRVALETKTLQAGATGGSTAFDGMGLTGADGKEDKRWAYTDLIEAADTFLAFGKDDSAVAEIEQALQLDPKGKEALIRALRLLGRVAKRDMAKGLGVEEHRRSFMDRMGDLREAIVSAGGSEVSDPAWEEALMLKEKSFVSEEKRTADLEAAQAYAAKMVSAGSLEEALGEPAGEPESSESASASQDIPEIDFGSSFGTLNFGKSEESSLAAAAESVAAESAAALPSTPQPNLEFSAGGELEGWSTGESLDEIPEEESHPAEWDKAFSLEGMLQDQQAQKEATLRSAQEKASAASASLALPESWQSGAAEPIAPELSLSDLELPATEEKSLHDEREEMSLLPMLDLADAYMGLGDMEGARKMLEEVASSSKGELGRVARERLMLKFGPGA